MTNHTKNKLKSWQFLLLFIASLGMLTGLGNLTNIQPFLSANIAKASESEASVKQKLTGRWRVTENGQNADMVFTPDGKIYFIPSGYESNYKVDTSLTSNRLSIYSDDSNSGNTFVIKFIDDKLNMISNQNTIILKKISSSVVLSEQEIKYLKELDSGKFLRRVSGEKKVGHPIQKSAVMSETG